MLPDTTFRVPIWFILILAFLAPSCRTSRLQEKPVSPPNNAPQAPGTQSAPADIPVAASDGDIAWLDSQRLRPVLEMAQQKQQPVFVTFYASWCAPCKIMEEEIFTQEQVFRYLNVNFLNFRTDFDSEAGQTIAAIFDVKTLPTVLFLDPQGVVLERHTGIANPSVIRSLGDSALAKIGH